MILPEEGSIWPLVCSCGEKWSESEYDAGSEGKLELRHCVCGATLTITKAQKAD